MNLNSRAKLKMPPKELGGAPYYHRNNSVGYVFTLFPLTTSRTFHPERLLPRQDPTVPDGDTYNDAIRMMGTPPFPCGTKGGKNDRSASQSSMF